MKTSVVFLKPRVLFEDQVLPAASAFFNPDFFLGVMGIKDFSFLVSYTEGAGGGGVEFELSWGDDNNSWIDTIRQFSPPTNTIYTDTPDGPIGTLDYIIPVTNPGGMNGIRLSVKEVGVPLTPGTVSMQISGVGY